MINTIIDKRSVKPQFFQQPVKVHAFFEIDVVLHQVGVLMTNRTAEALWRKCVNSATTKESAE